MTNPDEMPVHWTDELKRISAVMQRSSNVEAQGLTAIAAEIAETRRALLEPQVETITTEEFFQRRVSAWRAAWEPVMRFLASDDPALVEWASPFATLHHLPEGTKLQQVGWYCAGGHPVESTRCGTPSVVDATAKANLKFDDPCEHAVPIYALVKVDDGSSEA